LRAPRPATPAARRCRRGGPRASSSRTRLSHIAAARSAMQPQDESIGRTQPATSGRQVRTGFRQSIPSSM
jgi:hypothetical protein